MSDIRLPIRQLVEFLLRSGSIDSRFAGFDRALEGARIHRREYIRRDGLLWEQCDIYYYS